MRPFPRLIFIGACIAVVACLAWLAWPTAAFAQAGVTISPTLLAVPEGGSAEYEVVLDTQPTKDVTITVRRRDVGDEHLTATPASLEFTDSNWEMPQKVTVSAAEDDDSEHGIQEFEHTVESEDGDYDDMVVPVVTATEEDNDPAGVEVSPQHLAVPEGGSADYTVVLKTQPIADVTITVRRKLGGGETDLTATPASLTFTGSNWKTPQTVTVSAAEDDDSEDGTQEFEHPVESGDVAYHKMGAPVVRTTEEDNDTAGVTVSPRSLTVPEGGSAGYTVVLDIQPLFDVEITVVRSAGGDADLTATPDTLTFTNSNWEMPQTVTVSAAEDDNDKLDGSASFEHSTQSNDDSYEADAFLIESVTATEDDNDKADQTLEGFAYVPATITFGDEAPTVTAPSGAQTEVTYSASPGTVCSVDSGSGALTITGAGECTITATAAETADYDAASATFKLTVNKADQTLQGFAYSASQVTYGDTAPTVTAPSGAQTEVTYSASPGTVCSVDSGSGALTIIGAGECTITATAAATADYDAASATFKLTVNKADQTLQGFAYSASQVTYGDTAPTVTAPSGAQTEVTYSASPGTVCSVDSGSGALTITGAGECTITATAAATADYDAASATFKLTVNKADQTLQGFAYSASQVTYGDTAPTVTAPSGAQTEVTYSASPGTVCSVDSGSGALTIIGAGECTITATAAATADYDAASATFKLTVNKADQTLQGFAYSASQVTYGDTAPTVTAPSGAQTEVTYSASPGTVCSVDSGSGALTITGAGECTITATAAATADYDAASATFKLTVNKADQTLQGFAYSASQVTYGDTAPTVTAPSGAQTEVTYSASPGTVCSVDSGSGALTITGAGECTITATAAATADYDAASATFKLTVNKADQTLQGFAYSASQVTYGDTAPTVTAPSGAQTEVTYSASPGTVCSVDSGSGALTITGAGECTITATAAATADYDAASATFKLTVNKADQTLQGFAYSASQVTYGDTAPTVTAPSGAQTEVTYSASPGTVCSVDSGSGALTITGAGECTITATAAATADYDAASATFKLTVNKADQTLQGFAYSASQVTYGDTAPTVTAPSGAQTEVTYSASPGTVCSVDSGSGALTITGAGECTITATAAATADYKEGTATFRVTVAENAAPTANAGADRSVAEGAEVTLDGTKSSDPEGADLTFTWTQTAPESGAGSGVTLDTTDPSRPTFTAPTELLEDAVLTFSLTVSDGPNTSEADTVDITVTVGRNDAALSGLEISAGTLTPAFDVETTHYSVGVRNAVANVTVAPTTRYHGATVTVNGTTVDRNSASSAIDLAEKAETRIPVVVTAQNTRTTKTYIIAVTRALAALADLSAAPGDAQVVLTWADPGNSTITKYQISTDGGETFTDMRGSSATVATYTVIGLTNGTEYTFQVRAVNAAGAGAASSSATATPLWPAPTRLAATPGDGEVELTWDTNPGIAHYRVDIEGGGVSEAQFVSPGSESKTTATITELTNGTEYTFTVRAVEGSVDIGRPSTLNVTPLARSDAPDAPMVLSAAADVAEVALTWTDPGDDTITRYQVSTDGGETFTDIPGSRADTHEYTATGLTNGEEYGFAVRAQNVSGEGAASTAIATPLWPAPDKLAATPDSGRDHLQWDRNPGIANYRVDTTVTATDELHGSSTISAGSESKTTATIFGLTNGDEYSFTVRAVKDAVDISPPSSLNATPAAPATVPDAPTDLSATPGDRQVKLSWDDPNNLTIIGHEVRWKVKNSDNSSYTAWAVSDAATEHTVTGLTNGTEHQLQVRAVNGLGNGAASTAIATPMLLVRFGAASYGAEEGGDAVTVEVTLSERAAASLEVPITVTLRGETVASDYVVDGIDAGMLAFAKGDDTRTFTIKANQDDDFDDETVILGFGTLDGVLAGTPATAVLTITDDEGAAIRARFRRLNDEILSKHALTIADVTNRAVGARMEEACGEPAAAYTLAGGSTIYDTLRSTAWAIEDGTLTLDDALAGSSFLLPLGAANDDRAGGPGGSALWGRGDRQTLESRNSAFAWDGTVLTGQLGIDGCLGEDLVTGMTLSHSLGAFDYTDGTGPAPVSGAYESRMNSVHPYLGWSSPRGLGLWGTVGYGWGEIEIDDEQVRRGDPGDPVKRSDTTLKTAALGARGPVMTDGSLIAGGTTRVTVKGEASVARVEVDGDDELIEKQTVNANRLRMALEGSHEQALASGSSLTTSLELGLRHDGGDGITGGGIEIGGGLRYRDPAAGLTIEGNGRVLTGQGDYREWGLGGSLRLDPGADGRGMSLSVAPVYGDVSSGVARLWDQDVAELAANDRAADDSRPQGRLEAELGYGLPALGGHGLLTPYGGFSLVGDEGQLYRLGGRLEIGSAVTLGLEGERRKDGSDGAVDHGVMLRGQVRW